MGDLKQAACQEEFLEKSAGYEGGQAFKVTGIVRC